MIQRNVLGCSFIETQFDFANFAFLFHVIDIHTPEIIILGINWENPFKVELDVIEVISSYFIQILTKYLQEQVDITSFSNLLETFFNLLFKEHHII